MTTSGTVTDMSVVPTPHLAMSRPVWRGKMHSWAFFASIPAGVALIVMASGAAGTVGAAIYSATLLFHCVPAITDGLLRLPVGDPVLKSIEDPILKMCYLVLLVAFLIGATLQLRWIHRQPA